MPLKDILKRRDKTKEGPPNGSNDELEAPFTFLRTTTSTQEVIYPPSFPGDCDSSSKKNTKSKTKTSSIVKEAEKKTEKDNQLSTPPKKRPGLHFRSSSRSSVRSTTEESPTSSPQRNEKRLSSRLDKLNLGRRSRPNSAYVPDDLPEISGSSTGKVEVEAEWEKRAALLAKQNERSRGATPVTAQSPRTSTERQSKEKVPPSGSEESVNIQEAIRLHEAGDLERSTAIFGRLADPQGANDALAQILYGMALQHGWGIEASPSLAIHFHTLAASNSAAIESRALSSGSSQGGAAKGELVLAIYELGNAFRHGWGCTKDPVAARKYYETAAELGDVDAMVEVAWCYENGFGGAKDKFKAATFLRMAEEKGRKEVGNSWIYKDKYGGPKKTK